MSTYLGTIFGNDSVGNGTWAVCTVNNAGPAGTYPVTIRYSNTSSLTRPITVNGVDTPVSPGLTYPNSSGAWGAVTNVVPLRTGTNTIVIDSSYQYFDWLEFPASILGGATTTAPPTTSAPPTTTTVPTTTTAPPTTTTTTTAPATTTTTTTTTTPASSPHIEVENCLLGPSVSTYLGAIFGDDSVGNGTWAVCSFANDGQAGNYRMMIRYSNTGSLTRPVMINGVFNPASPGLTYPNSGGGWATLTYVVPLKVGANTFLLDTSYQYFDWVEFTP